jgi:hypothetical protein
MTMTQSVAYSPNVFELMGYHFASGSQERGVRDVACWSGAAVISFLALGALTTSPALAYSVYLTTHPTNPVITMPTPESEWFMEDDADMTQFLALMDGIMEKRPDLVIPADEEQLNRIAKLVANVKV